MLNSKSIPASRLWLMICATLGIIVGIIVVYGCMSSGPSEVPPPAPAEAPAPTPVAAERRTISPEAIEKANEQLNWAHGQSFACLDQNFAPVEQVFAIAQTREFAERCLSFRSKWLLLKDKLYESDEHTELIESAFRECIFDETELERILAQSAAAYVQEINSIDGEMLVRLAVDVAGLPSDSVPGFDSTKLHARYSNALQRAVAASRSDVLDTVKRETVSFIVSEAISAAMVQVGVSSGVLAAGAASGWTTFGTGLIIGILVDFAIQQYSDPVSELAAELDERLQELRAAILYGDEESPGLIPRLQQYAQARGVARRDALQEILIGSSAR